ncbi:MAG: response regulator, partial [Planctomycetes bacterium]|nr:response regulator [Planctomycetota bacterium]
ECVNAADTIRRNGEALLDIINDILDISKIEAGKLTVECIESPMLPNLADVEALMRVRADAKGLAFAIEFVGPVPETIRTDSTRLRQILINLIGNAIKFTQTGGVRVVVRLVRDEGAEPCMQFDVIDTGIGLTEAQTQTIFDPFTQADSSTTRDFGGTGLGLTISRRLANLLGGDITVRSRPGEGSLFRATVATGSLDAVKILDNPMETAGARVETPSEPPARGTRLDCRILVAEDGPDNQVFICHILRKAGADVTLVENGKLALDEALAARDRGTPFDVILMDMQMPVLDGYQATSLLRRKGYSGTIIALTAHAMQSHRQKCINAGCDEYASKPIDRKKLISLIQEHTAATSSLA